MSRRHRWISLLTVVALLCLPLVGADRAPALAASLRLPGLTNEVVGVRIGRTEQGFAKRGFFRLGVLPVVRLQEIELTFETGRGLAHLADGLARARELGAGKRVELGNTTIRCWETPFFRLAAESMDEVSRNHVALGGTVVLVTSGKTNQLRRAHLRCEQGRWSVEGLPASGDASPVVTIPLQ